jgi:AraC family transcriptional regulator, exoenzyme S synthesis regulatory protein ExsA
MENLLDFIKKTDLYRKFEVDDLLFAEFKCPYDDTKSGIWWHSNFFAYILAGETLLITPQNNYTLKPGDCVFAKKGTALTMSQTREDFCELLVFVPDEFIKTVIHKHMIPLSRYPAKVSDIIIPLPDDKVLDIYFQSLLSYFSRNDPPTESLLKLKFEELIVHIVSNNTGTPLGCYFSELCQRTKPSIKEIMDRNYSSNLSMDEFARLCARSLSTFKREFKELYQTSPGKWLMEKRLAYGRYLLDVTDLSIEDVCFESGFENRSHFIRAFRNKYRITPGKLKKQIAFNRASS